MKITKKIFSMLLVLCLLATLIPLTVSADSTKLDFSTKTSGTGNSITVKNVKYDGEVTKNASNYETTETLYELEVDFLTKVSWKHNAKITSVKDNKGKSYNAYLIDTDDDECEIYIANLKEDRNYTIVINGIRKRGTSSYRKLTLSVKIPAQKTSNKKIQVKKVSVDDEHGSYTEIDVKFASKVVWKKGAKVTSIKDNKGKSYDGYLADMDDDDCEIYIKNIKYDRTYTIKISGAKAKGASSYETLTITAKVPASNGGLIVKKVEYDVDYEYGETECTVSIDFNKDITHKSSSYVLITDADGNAYSSSSSYVEWDDDECEVHLSKELTIGNTYNYQVVDVKAANSDKYTTISGTFTAYMD